VTAADGWVLTKVALLVYCLCVGLSLSARLAWRAYLDLWGGVGELLGG
jgi:hypothetical protein